MTLENLLTGQTHIVINPEQTKARKALLFFFEYVAALHCTAGLAAHK